MIARSVTLHEFDYIDESIFKVFPSTFNNNLDVIRLLWDQGLGRRKQKIVVAEAQGKIVGAFPLLYFEFPKYWTFTTELVTPYNELLVDAAYLEQIVDNLKFDLVGTCIKGIFSNKGFFPGNGTNVISLTGSFDSYFASLQKKHQYDIKRALNHPTD